MLDHRFIFCSRFTLPYVRCLYLLLSGRLFLFPVLVPTLLSFLFAINSLKKGHFIWSALWLPTTHFVHLISSLDSLTLCSFWLHSRHTSLLFVPVWHSRVQDIWSIGYEHFLAYGQFTHPMLIRFILISWFAASLDNSTIAVDYSNLPVRIALISMSVSGSFVSLIIACYTWLILVVESMPLM